jgi:hypothetical protein
VDKGTRKEKRDPVLTVSMYAVIPRLWHGRRARSGVNIPDNIEIDSTGIMHSSSTTIGHGEIRPLIFLIGLTMPASRYLTVFFETTTTFNLGSGSASSTTGN